MSTAALFAQAASITAALTDFAVGVVGDLGLAGVFVLMLLDGCLVPIPSEATLLFAGFGVSQGRYGLLAVVVAGTLGNVVGIPARLRPRTLGTLRPARPRRAPLARRGACALAGLV